MVLERPTAIRCLKQDVRFPRVCESNEKIKRALLLGGMGGGRRGDSPSPRLPHTPMKAERGGDSSLGAS